MLLIVILFVTVEIASSSAMADRSRELGDFRGWVTLRLNFKLIRYVSANNYGPLDGEWL